MHRNVLITLLGIAALALVWGVLALALGSPSLKLGGSSASSNASPACLPATLNHTAALPGTAVDVSPEPETDTANPHTQISFLGMPAAAISAVSVVGQHSGAHTGRLRAYSQGDGASFAPDTPFDTGEDVTVHASASTLPTRPRTPPSSPTTPPRPPTTRASTRCPARSRRS
jgi:hypothetical protein